MLILIILLTLLSVATIFQTRILWNTKKERDILKDQIENIDTHIDEELVEKKKEINDLIIEIDKLENKAEYIKIDQLEIEREYKYLQDRNKKLEEKNLSIEERTREREKVK